MSAHPFDLTGRDGWVIGGAGYLGQASVKALVALNARVLCADLGTKAAEFVAAEGLAASVTPVQLDARDLASMKALVEEQIALRGVPDALIVMTYGATGKTLEDLTASDFDAANQSNLTATFELARQVGARMAERGSGSIVLFSSMYGTVSPDARVYESPMNPNPIEYGVGKAGIQQMARYLAMHWGRKGVRVNSVSPGPFPNPIVQRDHAAFVQRIAERTMLGRVGVADEIAGAVTFLAGPASSFVSGHNLAVDGGWTAW